jgi:hypothetical protein
VHSAIKAAVVALAVGGLVAVAQPAHADDTTPMALSCTTGGTTVHVAFAYTNSGYSVSYYDVTWSTSPGTKLDRIQLAQNPAGGKDSWTKWWWKGGKASSKGDVAASGGKAGFVNNVTSGHDIPHPKVRLSVWGDGGTCRKTKTL